MYPFIKRFFDFFFSLLALIILSPLLIPIVILLKITGEGHIFYFQKRIGFHNTWFNIWKFATMLKNSPNMGTGSITLRNDPRLLPMGKFLRKSKINELPQIINVLIGNMSIVGPRPLVDKTFNAYPEALRNKVYESKPGITGVGSVFFRDEEALISASGMPPHDYYEQVIAPYKGELEMWYNRKKSFGVDVALIFLTVWVVLFPKSRLMFRIFKDLPERTF
jgi:lipopolysaccharide/colanic/teichoic acid biosynthesis glycosyltransferase